MEAMITYLYVEDDEDIREGFMAVMEAPHRKIVGVADAEAALALDGHERFDVLVTDVSLPGMSGSDLARQWLANDSQRHVLLISGYEFKQGLTNIGTNVRALLKSCEPEDLEAMLTNIETLLAAQRP